MEIVDVVNEDDVVVDSVDKEVARQKGLTTRVAFVVLLNAKNELYLQQRKSTKKSYPLYWSGSAAGHVVSGETYLAAAERELQEELGVTARLQEIGKFTSDEDKEIVTMFVGRHEGPFTLEEAAIEQAAYFSLAQLQATATTMQITSYVRAVIPMVEKFLADS